MFAHYSQNFRYEYGCLVHTVTVDSIIDAPKQGRAYFPIRSPSQKLCLVTQHQVRSIDEERVNLSPPSYSGASTLHMTVTECTKNPYHNPIYVLFNSYRKVVRDSTQLRTGEVSLARRSRWTGRAPPPGGGAQLQLRRQGRLQLRLGIPTAGTAGNRVRTERELVWTFAQVCS